MTSFSDSWSTLSVLQENATSGEHLWTATSVSGDFCYVGEAECTVSRQTGGLAAKLRVISKQQMRATVPPTFPNCTNASFSGSI